MFNLVLVFREPPFTPGLFSSSQSAVQWSLSSSPILVPGNKGRGRVLHASPETGDHKDPPL